MDTRDGERDERCADDLDATPEEEAQQGEEEAVYLMGLEVSIVDATGVIMSMLVGDGEVEQRRDRRRTVGTSIVVSRRQEVAHGNERSVTGGWE